MTSDKIIAYGLLTERDLQALGPSFSRAWPVEDKPCFTQLLKAIDEADAALGSYPHKADNDRSFHSGLSRAHPIGDGRR